MKLHYKMFSVSIAFTLNMKTYCRSQEGFLCHFLFLILSPVAFFLLDSLFPDNLLWILYRDISSSLCTWFQKCGCLPLKEAACSLIVPWQMYSWDQKKRALLFHLPQKPLHLIILPCKVAAESALCNSYPWPAEILSAFVVTSNRDLKA